MLNKLYDSLMWISRDRDPSKTMPYLKPLIYPL